VCVVIADNGVDRSGREGSDGEEEEQEEQEEQEEVTRRQVPRRRQCCQRRRPPLVADPGFTAPPGGYRTIERFPTGAPGLLPLTAAELLNKESCGHGQ